MLFSVHIELCFRLMEDEIQFWNDECIFSISKWCKSIPVKKKSTAEAICYSSECGHAVLEVWRAPSAEFNYSIFSLPPFTNMPDIPLHASYSFYPRRVRLFPSINIFLMDSASRPQFAVTLSSIMSTAICFQWHFGEVCGRYFHLVSGGRATTWGKRRADVQTMF